MSGLLATFSISTFSALPFGSTTPLTPPSFPIDTLEVGYRAPWLQRHFIPNGGVNHASRLGANPAGVVLHTNFGGVLYWKRNDSGHRFVGAVGVPNFSSEISFAGSTVVVGGVDDGRLRARATAYDPATLLSGEAPWTLLDERWSYYTLPVKAMDDYVVTASSDDLIEIYDRRRPPNWSRVASISTPDWRALGVLGRDIVGVSPEGLSHFDARDPRNPVLVERRPEWAGEIIALSDETFFVGNDDTNETIVLSLAGGRLQERSRISEADRRLMTASGDLLYIWKQLYDVSELDEIEKRARVGHGGPSVGDVALAGDLLYLSSSGLVGVRVVDVSNPDAPDDLDTLRVEPLFSQDLTVVGERLYVTAMGDTVEVMAYAAEGASRPRLAELEDPTGLGFFASVASGEHLVTLSRSWAPDSSAVQIWSTPDLQRLGVLYLPGRQNLQPTENRLYSAGKWVALELDGLIYVVDLADPASPVVVCVADVMPNGNWSFDLVIREEKPHIFATDWEGVHAYDCSDSGGPYHRGSYVDGGDLSLKAENGGWVIVFDHEGPGQIVHLVDWSDMADPVLMDTLPMRDLWYPIRCTLLLENQLLMLDEFSLLESHAIENGRFGKRVRMPVAGGMRFDLTGDVLRIFHTSGVAEYVVNPGGAPPFQRPAGLRGHELQR